MSRRDLGRDERFSDVSPALGELDPAAFDELFEESPDDALDLLAKMSQATDRQLAALSRRLAGRVVLDLARSGPLRNRGTGRLTRVPADESATDLDLDASMDGLVQAHAERRRPRLDDLTATRWQQPITAVCLLVDRSGSMSGERLASAALAAAVCAWRAPAHFAVLAFGDKVIELKGLTQTRGAEEVVAEVLALRGHGTTDVGLALRSAHRQLAESGATRRLTVLLSDAEVTTGGDPIVSARNLDELVIVAPIDEPDHARDLAKRSGAKLAEVGGPMSVLDALRSVLE